MKGISQSIEKALSVYKNNLKDYLNSFLVILFVLFVSMFLSMFVLFGNDTAESLVTIITNPDSTEQVLSNVANPMSLVLSLGIMVMGVLFSYTLYAGVIGFTVPLLKKRKKKFDAIHTMVEVSRERGIRFILARILSGLIIATSSLLAIGLGYMISMGFQLGSPVSDLVTNVLLLSTTVLVGALFVMVDQAVVVDKLKPTLAIQKSYEFGKKFYLDLLLLLVLFGVLSELVMRITILGFLINVLVLTPIYLITYTHFYVTNRKR